MICFTICSKNFLAQGLTLYESLRCVHPDLTFYVALCDTDEGIDTLSLPFRIITMDELGMVRADEMKSRYNITELNTALKPFVFLYLFDTHPGESVVYLDPDIFVISGLVEVETALDSGAQCVLTPHIAEPAEFADFNDGKFLIYGIYNLGFCALRDTPAVRRVVSWWGRRLETQCVIDLSNGLFVDQKWADLLPAFLDDTVILRHCGYNVAYWNLSQRRVWRDAQTYMVNDKELRFAHFSGSVIGSKTVLSRHTGVFTRQNTGAFGGLLDRYEARLAANGHRYFSKIPYGFSWNGANGTNAHTPPGTGTDPRLKAETTEVEHLSAARHRGAGDHRDWTTANRDLVDRRAALEASLLTSGSSTIEGTCAVCRKPVRFSVIDVAAPGDVGTPGAVSKKQLVCEGCGLGSQTRAALHLFDQDHHASPETRVLLLAHATTIAAHLAPKFPGLRTIDAVEGKRGAAVVPFDDGSFDQVLALEVLEHSSDPSGLLRELWRCLRPGGELLLTTRFAQDREVNEISTPTTARRSKARSAPAVTCFGWELVDAVTKAGFVDAVGAVYWSQRLGYLGADQVVFSAQKPSMRGVGHPDVASSAASA